MRRPGPTVELTNSNDINEGILLTNHVPGSFFLAASDHDYTAHFFTCARRACGDGWVPPNVQEWAPERGGVKP